MKARNNIKKRIVEFETHMDVFRDEINWWLTLLNNTPYPNSTRLKKPIVIEMYEFCGCMIRAAKQINQAVKIISDKFEAASRKQPIEYLEKATLKTLKKWETYLRPFRKQIAAHRYTTKEGEFLELVDIMRLYGTMADKRLAEARVELFECHDKIKTWLSTTTNRNHLVLVA